MCISFIFLYLSFLSQWLPIFQIRKLLGDLIKQSTFQKIRPIFEVFYTAHSWSTYWPHNLSLNLSNVTHSNRLIFRVSLILATSKEHCNICCSGTCWCSFISYMSRVWFTPYVSMLYQIETLVFKIIINKIMHDKEVTLSKKTTVH